MTETLFSLIFVSALCCTLAVKFWLARRQIAHVVKNRDLVPEKFRDRITLAEHRKAADYTCAKTRFTQFGDFFEALVVLLFTFGGGLQMLTRFCHHAVDSPLLQGILLIALLALAIGISELPFSLYKSFVIEAKFGFNKLTPKLFLKDLLAQTLLAGIIGAPLVALVLYLMEKSGSYWWLYAWVVWVGFNLLLLAIYPNFIAPIFNKFSPLPEGALKERIEQLLVKCGFKSEGLFVMDGSKRSNHGNAYFTGFGKTKRIVFFDTLIERLNAAEVEAVLAHELGHFKLRHVIKRMVLIFAMSLFFLALLGYLVDAGWFFGGLGVQSASDAMALILFFMVSPFFTFLLKPLSSFYSRKNEFEADRYAAQNASADDLVNALVKLYQDNAATLTPDSLYSAFHDSHPPATLRIAHLQQAN